MGLGLFKNWGKETLIARPNELDKEGDSYNDSGIVLFQLLLRKLILLLADLWVKKTQLNPNLLLTSSVILGKLLNLKVSMSSFVLGDIMLYTHR